MSETNQPKFCAKCKIKIFIFLTFVKDFMLSKAWDIKILTLVEKDSSNVNRILHKKLYHNLAFWFGDRGCRTELPSCITEGVRTKCPIIVFMGYKAKRDTVTNQAETLVGEKCYDMRWHKCRNDNSYHCVKLKDENNNSNNESDS